MSRGDHIFVWRHHMGVPFQHHAIDLGDGTVVHFTDGAGGIAAPGTSTDGFEIQRTDVDSLTRGGRDSLHVIRHQDRYPEAVAAARAVSQIGRGRYHLLFDNCEHFACWCVVGRDESRQVSIACERAGAASAKLVAATSIRVALRSGGHVLARSVSPWMVASDAAQWITEVAGHHVGLTDPRHRRRAGRALGATTALGVGAAGGPGGMLVAGGLWAMGEIAAKASKVTYEQIRVARLKVQR